MVGMIFAAGLGTRLKPLTDTMPKALVPLAGKPLLQWQVEKLRDAGITDIIVNVHHFPDMIIDTIRQNTGWGCNILISDERDCLLDTGGGLRKMLNLLSPVTGNPLLKSITAQSSPTPRTVEGCCDFKSLVRWCINPNSPIVDFFL